MAEEVVAAGKSKEEVAYLLMRDLMGNASDRPKNPTREDYLNNYIAARIAVSGPSPKNAYGWLARAKTINS